jgi:predicted lipase
VRAKWYAQLAEAQKVVEWVVEVVGDSVVRHDAVEVVAAVFAQILAHSDYYLMNTGNYRHKAIAPKLLSDGKRKPNAQNNKQSAIREFFETATTRGTARSIMSVKGKEIREASMRNDRQPLQIGSSQITETLEFTFAGKNLGSLQEIPTYYRVNHQKTRGRTRSHK